MSAERHSLSTSGPEQTTTLRSQQEQILTTQAQHTAILRQIQHHLGIKSTPEHAIPSSSEPSQAPPFVDQPMPHQEPPTGEAAEPSAYQHHDSTHGSLALKAYQQNLYLEYYY